MKRQGKKIYKASKKYIPCKLTVIMQNNSNMRESSQTKS